MKKQTVFVSMFVVLALAAIACGIGSAATPLAPQGTDTPIPTLTLAGEVMILDAVAFTYGQEYIVDGLVQNNTNWTLTSIALAIEIKDSFGNSLLKDSQGNVTASLKINPSLVTLLPGEKSPFHYDLYMTGMEPASYTVTVTGWEPAQIKRADMEVRNTQVVEVNSFQTMSGDWLRLSGQVVNLSNQWVEIRNIAASGQDAQGQLLAVAGAFDWAVLLAPSGDAQGRDRTPFEMAFPNRGKVNDWAFYLGGEEVEGRAQYLPEVEITNHYFDANGDLHLVGWETNNGSDTVVQAIAAGAYAQDGTVLDVSFFGPSVRIAPGDRYPFDVSHFDVLKTYPQQARQVDHFSAQAEPWILGQDSSSYLDLQTVNDHIEKSGTTWVVTGDIVNTSDKDLTLEVVTVSISDAQNNLVAVNFSIVSTGNAIAPNETTHYRVTILLDPRADASKFTYSTAVQGTYK